MRSMVSPDASSPVIVPTVILMPRMQGFPPMTFGLMVIRSRFAIFKVISLELFGVPSGSWGSAVLVAPAP